MRTMRPIRETIPVEEATALALAAATPADRIERVSIDEADGRVLAVPVVSSVDVPPFDRAAMDGYAVIARDTFGAGRNDPKLLRSIQTTYSGDAAARRISAGECVEIATGAPVPEGADAVVMVEETEKTIDGIRIFTPVSMSDNARPISRQDNRWSRRVRCSALPELARWPPSAPRRWTSSRGHR
jgi:molybdopterin biosynthesis enzyme